MKVIDSGHKYELASLDGDAPQVLTFVKREGPGYPGNVGHYAGTTMQEVLRALIQRCEYVNRQIACRETLTAIDHLKTALWLFEIRAAKRHGRVPDFSVREAVNGESCITCGHVRCNVHPQPTVVVNLDAARER